MRNLWWTAPVVALVVLVWGWTWPGPPPVLPDVPAAQAEPGVAELQAEIDQLSARQSRLAAEVAQKGSGPPEPVPAGPAPEEDPGVQAAITLDEALARGRDPGWSSGAEDLVMRHVESTPGIELQDVECGRQLCRVELAVTDPSPEGLEAVQSAVPWHAPAFIAIETAAIPPVAVMYVAREGTVLPLGG